MTVGDFDPHIAHRTFGEMMYDNLALHSKLAKKNISIWVTFQREGIHRYPVAATEPKLADVSFLGNPHRHIFHFRVEISVQHNDRDVEFILFKRELEGLYSDKILTLNNKSCEMICEDILAYVKDKYPGRTYKITVSEDNENGATVECQETIFSEY